MKIDKAMKRDKKRNKRNKMRISGKSVFLIQEILIRKGKKKGKNP